jgi:hypothetical protein
MKKIGLGALLVLLVALIFAPTSGAAQLPLATSRLMTFAGPPACATQLSVTPATNGGGTQTQEVDITGVPVACQGLALELIVFGTGGTEIARPLTSTTMSAGTTTPVMLNLKIKVANIVGIALTIGGRGITRLP